MACDYENEAMGKFLLPSQPDEGNFTLRMAYENALKVYWHDHMHVMEAHEWWKQGEGIEDAHWEAEAARARAAAARARAVAEKEHSGAEEQSRKLHHLEEEGAGGRMTVEHCEERVAKCTRVWT